MRKRLGGYGACVHPKMETGSDVIKTDLFLQKTVLIMTQSSMNNYNPIKMSMFSMSTLPNSALVFP